MKIIGLFAVVAVTALGVAQAHAGDAAKGRVAMEKRGCWQCHGYEGQGGQAGPRLANTQLTEEALIAFVRNTAGAMPPFSDKIVSNTELSDIYAYLQARPKPADPATIPLLAN